MIARDIAGILERSIRTDSRRGVMLGTLVAMLSLIVVALVDYYFLIAKPSFLVIGILDELAHAATAVLFLLGIWRVFTLWLAAGCVGGAVLIDIDHLPAILASGEAAMDAGRPISHSMATVLILVILCGIFSGRGRVFALGAAVGAATHLLRDMATGGVPFFWPLDDRTVEIYYGIYAGIIVFLAVLPLVRFLLDMSDVYRPRNTSG